MEYHKHYLNHLYPLQDKFFKFFNQYNKGRFYLTGGTALSRFYFQHRYSEDLDFFSTEELRDFRLVASSIVSATEKQSFSFETEILSDNFLRFFIKENDISLKIDFVNEITFHWGKLNSFQLFAGVDNEKNILSNKLGCITRYEVKDIADIWILSKRLSFSWREIMDIANKKALVDPVEVSKIIKTLPREELNLIKWAMNLDLDEIYSNLQEIAEDILLGRDNTLHMEGHEDTNI